MASIGIFQPLLSIHVRLSMLGDVSGKSRSESEGQRGGGKISSDRGCAGEQLTIYRTRTARHPHRVHFIRGCHMRATYFPILWASLHLKQRVWRSRAFGRGWWVHWGQAFAGEKAERKTGVKPARGIPSQGV